MGVSVPLTVGTNVGNAGSIGVGIFVGMSVGILLEPPLEGMYVVGMSEPGDSVVGMFDKPGDSVDGTGVVGLNVGNAVGGVAVGTIVLPFPVGANVGKALVTSNFDGEYVGIPLVAFADGL